MAKTFYVTTPIYYPSGKLHIGSAYTTLFCDVYKRYKGNCGYETFFLTGMDEHGQKIQEKAKENNLKPQTHVDKIADISKKLWEKLDIKYDDFIRTTEDRHKIIVQKIFTKLLDSGDIYLGEYEGHYCMQCESYFTLSQLGEGNACPDCGRETKLLKEESYFLRLSKYQEQLISYIKANPDFIRPESRRNEVIAFIEQGLQDLSVSRTTFDWGIKVPGNERHIIYVWIDALSNYISALGYTSDNDALFNKYWQGDEVLHVVGKDILRFHAIYWPIMLMALGVELNFKLYAHGWILMKDGKMSKSKGNVIYPEQLVERYGLDALRYYLIRELPYGNDGVFTPEDFITRYNVDLANDFGNLASRTHAMINKYFNGSVKQALNQTIFDAPLIATIDDTVAKFHQLMIELKPNRAYEEVFRLIGRTNKYIDETLPWVLAKNGESLKLEGVLYHLTEAIRISNIMLSVLLVESSAKINSLFNISATSYADLIFGAQKSYTIAKDAMPLFPRLDILVETTYIQTLMQGEKIVPKVEKESLLKAPITIDDFSKIDIRVGEVISCTQHPQADKLLVSIVDLGTETRQIVSGIKEYYEPSAMVGKKVLVVTNLKPIKLRGVESYGMILAGSNSETLAVIEAGNLANGSIVK